MSENDSLLNRVEGLGFLSVLGGNSIGGTNDIFSLR